MKHQTFFFSIKIASSEVIYRNFNLKMKTPESARNVIYRDDCPKHLSVSTVTHFFSTSSDKVWWRLHFDRTWCPKDAEMIGHWTCRQRNLGLCIKHEKVQFRFRLIKFFKYAELSRRGTGRI